MELDSATCVSLVRGDRQAYTSVFLEFYGSLVLYSQRFVNSREVAEDIVQDFFCHLWENRKNLPGIRSFKTYLYASIRNRSLNHLRDMRSVPIEGLEFTQEEDFLLEMMEEEIYRELHAAIRELPDKCQQIYLKKLEGDANRDIAEELGITEETVRSQLRRGRELLQRRLSGLALVVLDICFF